MFYSKIFKLEVYETMTCFIVSDQVDEVNDFLKRQGLPQDEFFRDGDSLYATTILGRIKMRGLDYTCNYVVLNPYHKWSVISWGTIAHEIVHLKNAIFQL